MLGPMTAQDSCCTVRDAVVHPRVLVAIVLLATMLVAGCERARISSQVTAPSIRKISPGMRRMDVVAVLGQPLRERPGAGGVLLDYAIAGAALHGTVSMWILVDSHDVVDTVHVENYPMFADHYAIYEARRKPPVYEHPDFAKFIDAAH